jgi:hypothetical protein
MTLADQILAFNKSLSLTVSLPAGVQVMNPFQDPVTFELCKKFYHQFYGDDQPRKIILGINPGRLGGGATGIPITDPVKLSTICNIPNEFPKKTELSSDFIYTLIDAGGGPGVFYREFIFSSVCPLGFTKDGVNLNYYDDKTLERSVRAFVVDSIQRQLNFPINREICFCLGEGQNYKYLSKLNAEYSFFKKIVPLPHPRFIMQYRRKKIPAFVNMYMQKLKEPA